MLIAKKYPTTCKRILLRICNIETWIQRNKASLNFRLQIHIFVRIRVERSNVMQCVNCVSKQRQLRLIRAQFASLKVLRSIRIDRGRELISDKERGASLLHAKPISTQDAQRKQRARYSVTDNTLRSQVRGSQPRPQCNTIAGVSAYSYTLNLQTR